MSRAASDEIKNPRDSVRVPVDENLLEGSPPTTWRDFKHAKSSLDTNRRFNGSSYLGHGVQGIVYKASIGNGDPVAVKVFWRTQRPKPQPLPTGKGFQAVEWPFEDESRTVALLEKIKWAMAKAEADPEHTIRIKNDPKTLNDAINNLYAFSDETRRSPQTSADQDLKPPPPFPSLPICYGWMRVKRNKLPVLDPPVWEEVDQDFEWQWAIVYEFVQGTKQDTKVAQTHLDFFYATGFAMEAFKQDNWHGGRLIDMNDVCSLFARGWHPTGIRPRVADTWFWTLEFVRAPVIRRRIVRRPDNPHSTP